jgi:hypothetical protein
MIAQCFHLFPQFRIVVDFSIVDDPISRFRVLHWLVTRGGEIKNRQPTVTKNQGALPQWENLKTLIVWPSVCLRTVHGPNRRFHLPSIPPKCPGNPAHMVTCLQGVLLRHSFRILTEIRNASVAPHRV